MSQVQLINLLPEEKIRLLHIERINALATVVVGIVGVTLVVATLVLLLLIGGLSAGRSALASNIAQSKTQIARIDKLDNNGGNLESQSQTLQSQLAVVKAILDTKNQVQFGKALERLVQIVPSDVSFSQAAIDENHVVTLTGKARSFASIGRFAEALKSDGTLINQPKGNASPAPYFQDVEITSTTYNDSEGVVNYALSFKLGEETFNAKG